MESSQPRFRTAIPYLAVLFSYSTAWLATALIARGIWGSYQIREDNFLLLSVFYFIPLLLIGGYLAWTFRNHNPVNYVSVLWIVLFAFVVVNVFILKIPFQRYGDQGQLNYLLATRTPFARYLVGSEALAFIYQKLVVPLFLKTGVLETNLADAYVRLLGSALMIITALILVRKHSRRLAVLLPLTIPVWLLFSSGYNEYYPFIAPLFMVCLLFIDIWNISRVHPILIGLLAAIFALVYAAFIPIALFLIGLYFLRAGFRKGGLALVFAIIWSLALIVICWSGSFANFFQQYVYTLNLGDVNSIDQFIGQALGSTPFFKPLYAFSADHLKMMFFMLFWGGGIASFLILVTGIILAACKHKLADRKFIIPGLFLVYQIVYFFFMIPKLGPLQDIDLFFPVYLTIAYMAGLVIDHFTSGLPEMKQRWFSLVCFALVAANTAYCIYYLLLWGIPFQY